MADPPVTRGEDGRYPRTITERELEALGDKYDAELEELYTDLERVTEALQSRRGKPEFHQRRFAMIQARMSQIAADMADAQDAFEEAEDAREAESERGGRTQAPVAQQQASKRDLLVKQGSVKMMNQMTRFSNMAQSFKVALQESQLKAVSEGEGKGSSDDLNNQSSRAETARQEPLAELSEEPATQAQGDEEGEADRLIEEARQELLADEELIEEEARKTDLERAPSDEPPEPPADDDDDDDPRRGAGPSGSPERSPEGSGEVAPALEEQAQQRHAPPRPPVLQASLSRRALSFFKRTPSPTPEAGASATTPTRSSESIDSSRPSPVQKSLSGLSLALIRRPSSRAQAAPEGADTKPALLRESLSKRGMASLLKMYGSFRRADSAAREAQQPKGPARASVPLLGRSVDGSTPTPKGSSNPLLAPKTPRPHAGDDVRAQSAEALPGHTPAYGRRSALGEQLAGGAQHGARAPLEGGGGAAGASFGRLAGDEAGGGFGGLSAGSGGSGALSASPMHGRRVGRESSGSLPMRRRRDSVVHQEPDRTQALALVAGGRGGSALLPPPPAAPAPAPADLLGLPAPAPKQAAAGRRVSAEPPAAAPANGGAPQAGEGVNFRRRRDSTEGRR